MHRLSEPHGFCPDRHGVSSAVLILNVLRLCFALQLVSPTLHVVDQLFTCVTVTDLDFIQITPVDVDPACYVILFTEP